MTDLFSPVRMMGLDLRNRIAMSAMTRTRAAENGALTDLMIDYYEQRAAAGLIVTECTEVSDQGHGAFRCPGIHRQDQIDGWRKVTNAVHAQGGRIVLQLGHCGRAAHPDMRGGEMPVAPSAIAATGGFYMPTGRVAFPRPRALGLDEIAPIVADYARATRNARAAGFDGVELHAANGYLPNQFLEAGSNQRTDAYGGTIKKRARFILETVDAMIDSWAAERVGVRLSPSSTYNGMQVQGVLATYTHVVRELDNRRPGYLCLLEPNESDLAQGVEIVNVAATFRPMTRMPIMSNTGFTKAKGDEFIARGLSDVIAFGVPFLANPDLVRRLSTDAALNVPEPSTFYGIGRKGYTDYPALSSLE